MNQIRKVFQQPKLHTSGQEGKLVSFENNTSFVKYFSKNFN
jgi:hypothetical protein